MTLDNLRSDANFLLNTTTANYPDADLVRNINTRYDDTVSLILQSDSRWKWDDVNQTDNPIGLINLVDGQQDYEIVGSTYLKVLRVEVKDINGKYYFLYPIDEKEVQNQALTEFMGTAGRPVYYDKFADSLWLYPKPSSSNVTLVSGLKVYYQRAPSYFVVGDTTKAPGFAALYHRILSIGAALDYAVSKELTGKINILTPMLKVLQDGLVTHYSTRAGDEKISMRTRRENYGNSDSDYDSGGRNNSDKVAFY